MVSLQVYGIHSYKYTKNPLGGWITSPIRTLAHVCSGSILSENQVLTAGHCFRYVTKDRFELGMTEDEVPDSGVPIEYEDPKDWIVVSGTLYKFTKKNALILIFTMYNVHTKLSIDIVPSIFFI